MHSNIFDVCRFAVVWFGCRVRGWELEKSRREQIKLKDRRRRLSMKCKVCECFVCTFFILTSASAIPATLYVCMYGHTYSKSMDQRGKVADPARGRLNRGNAYFPARVRA